MEIIISNSSDKPIYEQIAMQIKSLIFIFSQKNFVEVIYGLDQLILFF